MLLAINWRPNKKEMRSFGWILLAGLFVLGVIFALVKYRKTGETDLRLVAIFAGCGALVWLCAFFLEKTAGLILYRFWMGIAFCLGMVIGPVVISLAYFLVITPIGLLLRLSGKDFLQLKSREAPTHWHPLKRKTDKRSYERQF